MTELLTKAFEKASKLPHEMQDEVARRLLEDLLRGQDLQRRLEAGYREMAADREREAAAEEWSENLLGDLADEAR